MKYDGADVFKVKRIAGGFVVKHYEQPEGGRACCSVKVLITDEDRRQGGEADPLGESAALARVGRAVDKKHGRGLVDNKSKRV